MLPTIESIAPYMKKAQTFKIPTALYKNAEGIIDREKLVSLVKAEEDKRKREAESKQAEKTRARRWWVRTIILLVVGVAGLAGVVVAVLALTK